MKKLIITILFTLSSPFALAWDGYDYENGTHIEIDKGNLVRNGSEIEFYDYQSSEYRSAVIQDINSYGPSNEVEVYDYDTGEYRTFEMD